MAHGIQPYLERCIGEVRALLASEVYLFTGATAPSSPSDCICMSGIVILGPWKTWLTIAPPHPNAIQKCAMRYPALWRSALISFEQGFSLFWERCDRFQHLRTFAMHLRAFPTNTSQLESTFSMARRILSWDRMRLTGDHASKLCLLWANKETTQRVLGLETSAALFFNEELSENWLASNGEINDHISDEEE